MSTLRLVLGDQLSPSLASLQDADRDRDIVLMAEVMDECSYVGHHKKKLIFVLSAMRHFARELEADGFTVRYVMLDEGGNTGSLKGETARAAEACAATRVVITSPGEYRLLNDMQTWAPDLQVEVDLRNDDRFLANLDDFDAWADGRKELRMEFFYREMRKKTGFLMTKDGKPEGGTWNLDKENRKPIKGDLDFPGPSQFTPDDITQDVIALVERTFPENFGTLDGFSFAVTRHEAEHAFRRFVAKALPHFGDYQDAMTDRDPFLYHAVISAYLNAGLLDPHALCAAAETAYRQGDAPLNAVEGFIRQILGWREFVRGIYWREMPHYKSRNVLQADRPLPDFYWTGETGMACMAHAIGQTRDHAYAHHIQRLMVTGNFALLAGIHPDHVNDWYMRVYADAYEWVELPNTHGMALWADGGIVGSKPYAASGKYIDRMSDHCAGCAYDVKQQTGTDACPFNALYWDFLVRHKERFAANPRMGLMLRSLERMDAGKLSATRTRAREILGSLDSL